ncbi:4Fe-4S dicluster domain-containing protein [Lachnospiraceae bacterium ZAX-1]
MKVFYFTATGNCLYAAKYLSDGNHESIIQAAKSDMRHFTDDVIGFVFPTFAFCVPKIFVEFLETHTFSAQYVFAIATCGTFHGGALSQFQKILAKQNVRLNYSNFLNMAENYLPNFPMDDVVAKQRNDSAQIKLKEIKADIKVRTNRLYKDKFSDKAKYVMGGMAYGKILAPNLDERFQINDTCIKCGICVRICPVNNIWMADKPQFQHRCIHCMACIQNCPVKALRHTKEGSGGRYRHPGVETKEIVEANE